MNLKADMSYLIGRVYLMRRRLFGILCKRRFMYNGKFLNSAEDTHSHIRKLLSDDKPCMIARYGFTEAQLIGRYMMKKKPGFKKDNMMKCGNWLYDTGGFFSREGVRSEADIEKFAKLMINDSKEVDLLGCSYTLLEDYVVNHCLSLSSVKLTDFDDLRIMVCEDSWGKALEGKNVLVISPFSKSIQSQYKRRELIYKNPNILPCFNLITYKAIQTIAGNNVEKYDDWFQALGMMKKDIAKINFDIAIIGCGAYGFPLAAECKRLGKKAFHLGGQTQMCFGILGKRWEEIPYYKQFINEYWIRPSDEEIPKNFEKVEGGCYW